MLAFPFSKSPKPLWFGLLVIAAGCASTQAPAPFDNRASGGTAAPTTTNSPSPSPRPQAVTQAVPPQSGAATTATDSASIRRAIDEGNLIVVQPGETLSQIARRTGVSIRTLMNLNQIEDPELIQVGQRLWLRQPASSGNDSSTNNPVASKVPPLLSSPRVQREAYSDDAYRRAIRGDVGTGSAADSASDKTTAAAAPVKTEKSILVWPAAGRSINSSGKSLLIEGNKGEAILAADTGVVSLAGGGLSGYGQMIIVRHSNGLVTVYGNNGRLLVKEGERIERGQKIAEFGESASGEAQPIRFEVRLKGQLVSPLPYLPKR